MSVEEYRQKAAECFAAAHAASDPTIKAEFMGVGQVWLRLAEQAGRNSSHFYDEAPSPKSNGTDAD